jgi:hypothetical protein
MVEMSFKGYIADGDPDIKYIAQELGVDEPKAAQVCNMLRVKGLPVTLHHARRRLEERDIREISYSVPGISELEARSVYKKMKREGRPITKEHVREAYETVKTRHVELIEELKNMQMPG